uniref:Complex 1 LYR protein domain-containing protein n=1 Tax=Astatotilapia calliptera TaxID=8154 RepID=A0AAX7T583_ASTCA
VRRRSGVSSSGGWNDSPAVALQPCAASPTCDDPLKSLSANLTNLADILRCALTCSSSHTENPCRAHSHRNYALRRVRDAFKANRNVEDPKAVERLMEEGWQTLALIQRQVSIGKMYEAQKTVVD